MQSTFIKIKFMALVRHLENDNTKCLLEIVPEVSCIENIDKIKFNEENQLIEYNLPVNYKIIFKKGADKNQEKIYYSCIDFRHLTIDSNLACGDVAKVFSDNFILRAVTADSAQNVAESCQLGIKNDNGIIIRELISKNLCYEKNYVDIHEIEKIHNTQELHQRSFSAKAVETEKDNLELNVDDIKSVKTIKPLCTESAMSKETITDITEIRSDQEKKRKLTITSICTLNTIDMPTNRTFDRETINNSKISVIHENNAMIHNMDVNKEKKLLSPYKPLYMFDENLKTEINAVPYTSGRILPDTRVAHFMMTVENEILPLRIMLSEIYRKCTLLGLFWKSSVFETSHQQFSNKNKIFTQRKPKCNRVVYSIVFEE